MQGKVKRLSLLMAAIIVAGCAQTLTPNTSNITDKQSFSVKMTKEEIFRKQLEKWISQRKGKQLVDELYLSLLC